MHRSCVECAHSISPFQDKPKLGFSTIPPTSNTSHRVLLCVLGAFTLPAHPTPGTPKAASSVARRAHRARERGTTGGCLEPTVVVRRRLANKGPARQSGGTGLWWHVHARNSIQPAGDASCSPLRHFPRPIERKPLTRAHPSTPRSHDCRSDSDCNRLEIQSVLFCALGASVVRNGFGMGTTPPRGVFSHPRGRVRPGRTKVMACRCTRDRARPGRRARA